MSAKVCNCYSSERWAAARHWVWVAVTSVWAPSQILGALPHGASSSGIPTPLLDWTGGTFIAVSLVVLGFLLHRNRLAQKQIRELESELESLTIDTRRRLEARTLELERANGLLHREALDRKEAQIALADRESRLSDAQQIAHVGSFHWNVATQELHWSDELHRIYGEDPRSFRPNFEAYVGHIHAEDQTRVIQRIRDAMQRGVGFSHDYRVVRPNGEIRWVSAISKCLLDPAGKLVGLAGTCQDITDRKHMEEARQEEALWRRTLLQNSRDGIVVLTEDGSVHEINDRFAEMLGYPKEELLRLNLKDWEAEMSPERLLEKLRGDHSKAQPFETRHRRKDGSIYAVEMAYSDTLWEGRKFILAICRDVTDRKRGERMLATQAEVLERIARGAPLSDTLDRLLRAVDEQGEGLRSSILLLDESGQYLSSIAGPSLPEVYSQALQNVRIGPKVGSCGTAAFTRRPVYVCDIATDPLWEDYRGLAIPFGLTACWSTPILDAEARVLGTLAIYTGTPSLPTEHHKRVIEAATHTAAICINRVRSEEALKASETNLRRAQSMAHVGSWIFDLHSRQFHGSEESRKLCGWEARPHTDDELLALIHPDDLDRTLDAWQQALTGKEYEIEHRLVVQGKTRWVHARAHAERDDSGDVVRITGMTQDITDRKRLEIALRALSSAAVLGSGDAFYRHLCTQLSAVFEFTGTLIAELHSGPNPSWTVLGFDGEPCNETRQLPHHLNKIGNQVLQIQKSFTCRELQLFPHCTPLPVSDCLVIPLFDSSCHCIGLMAVCYPEERHSSNDWSTILRLFSERAAVEIERNRSLSALQTAEARFRSVIENSHDCLTLIDCDGRFSYTSPALESILGYTAEELIGREASSIISPDHLETFHSHRQCALESTGTHVSFEVMALHRDGTSRWLRISETNRLEDPSLRAIVANWQDVSGQKAAEIARARLESQLRQSQKMEAIGTLAGGIAHDFNNILGAITGYAELALLQCEDHQGIRADLKDILKSGFRAKDLVRQILTFSRQQEPQRVPIALDTVISDSMRLLRAGVPANIELAVSIPKDLPGVLADATQIQQVLLNLVSNAAAAIGNKAGRIEVELAEVQTGSEMVERHPDFTPGPAVRLAVRDTGPGIEPAILDRIFEPFFTTKGPGQGTGLGLSVVHGIIRSHEGVIDVYSEPGQGTEFEIYLPVSSSPAPDPRGISTTAESLASFPLQKSTGTILLVDDETSLLRVTAKILQIHGYDVLPASSPSEALELFQHSANVIDLIITDFAMPGCNGVDFGRQILGLRPTIPIILCSGHGAGMNRERALELGFAEFLSKPVGMHRLISIVSALVEHSHARDQDGTRAGF